MNGLWRGVWGAAFSSPSSWFSSSSSLRPSSSLSASPSLLSFGAASSSWSFQHRRLAGGALSAPWFSQFTSSAFFSSSASSCAAAPTLSEFPTAKDLIRNNPSVLDPYCTFENNLSRVPFAFDLKSTNALKALKKAKLTAVADGNGFGFLETEEPFFDDVESSNILFVREFYPRLLARIRELRRVILIGNPGISKSVFQAYYIHQLMQPGPLPPNHFKSTTPPKVVLRQEGLGEMQVMFLEEEAVFTVKEPGIGLVRAFNPETTEYLVEPGGDKFEPFFVRLTLPIRLSCSPDVSRYKEFNKNEGAKVFMPCWSLDELRAAGQVLREKKLAPEDVDFDDKAIVQRFKKFGGIIRYVLPASSSGLQEANDKRKVAVDAEAERILVLSPMSDIERNKERPFASHFLLQYDVNPETFKRRDMKLAGPLLFEELAEKIEEASLERGCDSLRQMFKREVSEQPFLFEVMVANGIVKQHFTWHIHDQKTQQWQPFKFPDLKPRCFAKNWTPSFAEMETGVLYRSDDTRFPLVDMFFKSADDEVTAIQVTFAASHAKPTSVFQLFRETLQLPSHVRCRVLMVPDPQHAERYARRDAANYVRAGTKAVKQPKVTQTESECEREDEEASDDDDDPNPQQRAARQQKAEFLKEQKFEIATLRLTLPETTFMQKLFAKIKEALFSSNRFKSS